MEENSVGPALMAISTRYQSDREALETLSQKVLNGGSGVWGEKLMSAHPQHNLEEVEAMVNYILSLTKESNTENNLPLNGSIPTNQLSTNDLLLITAKYQDQGGGGQSPIEREVRKILRPTIIPATEYDFSFRITPKPYNDQGDLYAEVALNGCYIGFESIDFTDIFQVKVKLRSNANFIKIEARKGSSDGEIIASERKDLECIENKWAPFAEKDWFYINLPIPPQDKKEDLYFVFYSDKEESDYIYFDICQVQFF